MSCLITGTPANHEGLPSLGSVGDPQIISGRLPGANLND